MVNPVCRGTKTKMTLQVRGAEDMAAANAVRAGAVIREVRACDGSVEGKVRVGWKVSAL